MLPYDSLNSDVSSADSVQLSVTFSFDGYPMRTSEGAAEACLEAYKALGHKTLMKNPLMKNINNYIIIYLKLNILIDYICDIVNENVFITFLL